MMVSLPITPKGPVAGGPFIELSRAGSRNVGKSVGCPFVCTCVYILGCCVVYPEHKGLLCIGSSKAAGQDGELLAGRDAQVPVPTAGRVITRGATLPSLML